VAGWARARQAVVAGVLPVLVAVGLFGLLAGCGHSRGQAVTSTAGADQNPPGSGRSTDPGPARTTPAPTAGQPARPSAGTSPGGQSVASPGATGDAASTDAAGTDQAAVPDVAATSVFVGEPCLPSQDTAPAPAINGLTLFCVPATGPAAATSLGAWSDTPPQQKPTGPAPGTACTSSDLGQVHQDSAGRPVTCLREPNGDLRWADIS